jgi:carboxyl-terminal processing protease
MKKIIYSLLLCLLLSPAALAKNDTKNDISRNLRIFNSVYKELISNYVDTIDAQKSLATAINSMLGEIDPYTEYYPADMQDELLSLSTGNYAGVGSYLQKRKQGIVFSQPRWDSPARNSGIRHGDIILAVDDLTVTDETAIDEVSKRLRGQAGTKVNVKVHRPYVTDSILNFEITRRQIDVDPLPYYGILRDGIGYIGLTTFNANSADAVKDAIADMRSKGDLKALILDLRGNGGGLLESAVSIVGNFVPKGTEVVTTRYKEPGNYKTYKTTRKPIDTELPIAVLTDGSTASASEIVAGALQDLDRAVIVGNRSYGKGLVQNTRPLPYDGLLKVTVARYYIPSGRLIQAIDYSHRDSLGNVTRIPDSLTNVYYTAAGRPVRDGGGITPDVTVKQKETNRLLFNIVRDFWAYDFATKYAAEHSDESFSPDSFEVNDSIFNLFKAFIDPEKFQYDHYCETGIKYLREAAETEGYMTDEVRERFDELEQLLKHDLNHDLDHNRKDIIDLLDYELCDRFFSESEIVRRTLRHDDDVDEAVAILISPERYKMLLTPAKVSDNK